jgi:type II secretory pathway component PulF
MIDWIQIASLSPGVLLGSVGERIFLSTVGWVFLLLLPAAIFFLAVYLLFSLPLRRKERARLFLDLLEVTLRQGRPLEPTLVSLSNTRDPAMGVRFHLLGAHLENGLSLARALDAVPRLLPPRVAALIQAGQEIGNLRRVLPACVQTISDATSQTRSAINYLVVLAFVITPISAFVPWFLLQLVVPRFREVLAGMLPDEPLPPLLNFIVMAQPWITAGLVLLIAALWLGALLYVGGPRLSAWLQAGGPRLIDRLELIIPWQCKRLQRDFSSLLAVLLDSGLAEAHALVLAAQSTTNDVFTRRARKAAAHLESGSKLTEAVSLLDESGEFHWRFTNAVHGRCGFVSALTGWHEALDAKANQQEQAASQLFTTALVLLNGFLIGLVMLTIFGALVAIIDGGLLW